MSGCWPPLGQCVGRRVRGSWRAETVLCSAEAVERVFPLKRSPVQKGRGRAHCGRAEARGTAFSLQQPILGALEGRRQEAGLGPGPGLAVAENSGVTGMRGPAKGMGLALYIWPGLHAQLGAGGEGILSPAMGSLLSAVARCINEQVWSGSYRTRQSDLEHYIPAPASSCCPLCSFPWWGFEHLLCPGRNPLPTLSFKPHSV